MRTKGKVFAGLLALIGLFFLLNKVMTPFFDWVHPDPKKILSRMEQQDPETAQEIIDEYSEELKMIAAATDGMEEDALYSYTLNSSASWDKETLDEMPQELVDALRQMEQKFRECDKNLCLRRGQIGVLLTDDGGGFSFLCYPSGELMTSSMIESEQGTRCLDMGDGWELQMFYLPKG